MSNRLTDNRMLLTFWYKMHHRTCSLTFSLLLVFSLLFFDVVCACYSLTVFDIAKNFPQTLYGHTDELIFYRRCKHFEFIPFRFWLSTSFHLLCARMINMFSTIFKLNDVQVKFAGLTTVFILVILTPFACDHTQTHLHTTRSEKKKRKKKTKFSCLL